MFKRIKFIYTNFNYKIIKNRIQKKNKISVGFLVIYGSVFQYRSLFELISKDPKFSTQILIIPDTARGKQNMLQNLEKSFTSLNLMYPKKVSCSYQNDSFIKINKQFDIIFFCNPYDKMTHKNYRIKTLKKHSLTCYSNYFYFGKLKHELTVVKTNEFNYFWKIFTESPLATNIIKEHIINKNQQLITTGYIKMDNYTNNSGIKSNNIMIAPHHSIHDTNKHIAIGNFLDYADFFIELPKIYPQLNFIFRPHPLLFQNLITNNLWSTKKLANYLSIIKSIKNINYDTSNNYFNTFNNSSALIHDCGSFLAEYLYTDYPQCFILRKDKVLKDNFIKEGITLLDKIYTAKNQQEILNFINTIVINQHDTMKKNRLLYAKKSIRFNHLKASKTALLELKSSLNI